ncbi:MAG TPA: chemotaxis protein CheB [Segetibacter sp.]|jgi:two-component system chemotaxis response regulator CheB
MFNSKKNNENVRDIVVVGASAGGVEALKELVRGLPKDFKGSIFIVLHVPSYSETRLPWILTKACDIEAVLPDDGEEIQPGKIYVAPNDHHMLLQEGRVVVKKGPKENRFRPAIDALFRSAAYVYGSRVIGIILSGLLDDGASGLWTIKQQKGIAIVQKPDDAEQPQLPKNVLQYADADYTVAASDMGPLIAGLVKEPAPHKNKLTEEELKRLEMEVVIATKDNAFEMGIMDMGELTPFTCPECAGTLVRLAEADMIRFRCHTGHAYTASSLAAEVTESVENKMWQSMRALEEVNLLMNNIADHYKHLNKNDDAKLFREKAKSAADRAQTVHDLILQHDQFSEDTRLNKKRK